MTYCENRLKCCYICGLHVDSGHREFLETRPKVVFAMEHYFEMNYIDLEYAPPVVCGNCSRTVRGWRNHENRAFWFKYPMRWLEPTGGVHIAEDCYFCVNHNPGYRFDVRSKMPIVPVTNVELPVERTAEDRVPVPPPLNSNVRYVPPNEDINFDFIVPELPSSVSTPRISSSSIQSTSTVHSEYIPPGLRSTEKHEISEKDFDDLCRDFRIPVYLSEDLLSRLKDWNLMKPGVTIAHVRNRHHVMDQFFTTSGPLSYCSNIEGLFHRFSHPHDPNEWTLFIDSSLESMFYGV